MSLALDLNDDEVDALFGGYIRTHRNYLGLTLNQLAWRTQMQAARIEALERGEARVGVRAKEIQQLAKALGLDQAELTRRAGGGV